MIQDMTFFIPLGDEVAGCVVRVDDGGAGVGGAGEAAGGGVGVDLGAGGEGEGEEENYRYSFHRLRASSQWEMCSRTGMNDPAGDRHDLHRRIEFDMELGLPIGHWSP